MPRTSVAAPSNADARVESFPPRVTRECRVLVLGSMPGVRSLALSQYYGHPHNLFWPFMQALCGVPADLPYATRVAALNAAGVGLWDVLKACERPGSLDSEIAAHSEEPNAIGELVASHPSLRALAFNGGKAWQSFRRHVQPRLPDAVAARVALVPLPSTSPANASVPRGSKLERWLALRQWL
jgi:hypoxanthine-DNA glycosylase